MTYFPGSPGGGAVDSEDEHVQTRWFAGHGVQLGLGIAAVAAAMTAMVLVVLWALGVAWHHYPNDGFLKHDSASRLLQLAESVPMPPGVSVVSRSSDQGVGDANSAATLAYLAPSDSVDVCNQLVVILTSKHWSPRDLYPDGTLALAVPANARPAGLSNPDIVVTCRAPAITVRVDGS